MRLCTPAFVYLVISIIALIWNFQISFRSAIVHLFVIGLWTYILNWFCEKGYVGVSWALVLLPYAFTAFFMLVLFDVLLIANNSTPLYEEPAPEYGYPTPEGEYPTPEGEYPTPVEYTQSPDMDMAQYTVAPEIYYTEPTSKISVSDLDLNSLNDSSNTNISVSDIDM